MLLSRLPECSKHLTGPVSGGNVPNRMAKNQTLIAQLADRLYTRIVRRRMQPGDRFGTERELAADFGVAYGTMREAVGRLRGQSILTGRPRHGLIVQRPAPFEHFGQILPLLTSDEHDVARLREFRASIELGALHLAIDRADPAFLDQMHETVEPFETLQAQQRTEESDVYDIRFHELLLQASGNEYLMSLHDVITQYFVRVRKQYPGTAYGAIPARTREHRLLLGAMRKNDRREAADILWRHLIEFELKGEMA